MAHEDQHDDEGSAEPRTSAWRGSDDDGTAPTAVPHAGKSGDPQGDRGVRSDDRAIDEARNAVDDLGEVVDAEVVNDGPNGVRSTTIEMSWSGELPHPGDLERYEALCPGITSRLLDQKDRQLSVMETRARTVERAVDGAATTQETLAQADREALARGQWLSWSISFFAILAAIVGIAAGQTVALVALIVPIIQVSARLIRTVTDGHGPPAVIDKAPDEDAE